VILLFRENIHTISACPRIFLLPTRRIKGKFAPQRLPARAANAGRRKEVAHREDTLTVSARMFQRYLEFVV